LGLLALLLGFTFSMSMQRYDDRSQAVIEEANAIGTAVLRVQLLPAKYQSKAIGLMLGYSSGLSGKRVIAPTVMVSFLIAMIAFIIIDLDRPRRGLIRVDQNSLLELHQQNGDYLPNRF